MGVSMLRLMIALLVMSLGQNPANSQETKQNVQRLLGWCKQPQSSAGFNLCVGFVGGVGSTMVNLGQVYENKPETREITGLCGSGATVGAMVQAFTNWAEGHPEEWTMNAGLGVMLALREKWPCP